MRLDPFSNPIFNEQDLFDAMYNGHQLTSDMFVDISDNVSKLEKSSNLQFWLPLDEYDLPLPEYDAAMQADWFMPDEYKNMDIEAYLVSVCPKENYERLIEELQEFRNRNMLDLLRWLKYFVDTMQKEGIVWGVGRGSSVASYVLFLLEIHMIDPLKYNLDWREFLR
jgi:DNA polymerase III alpha subunit